MMCAFVRVTSCFRVAMKVTLFKNVLLFHLPCSF